MSSFLLPTHVPFIMASSHRPSESGEAGRGLGSPGTGTGRVVISSQLPGGGPGCALHPISPLPPCFSPTPSFWETQMPSHLTKGFRDKAGKIGWGLFVPRGGELLLLKSQECCLQSGGQSLRARGALLRVRFPGPPPPSTTVLANKYLQQGTQSCNSAPFFCCFFHVNTVKMSLPFPLTQLSCPFGISKVRSPDPFKSQVTVHQR